MWDTVTMLPASPISKKPIAHEHFQSHGNDVINLVNITKSGILNAQWHKISDFMEQVRGSWMRTRLLASGSMDTSRLVTFFGSMKCASCAMSGPRSHAGTSLSRPMTLRCVIFPAKSWFHAWALYALQILITVVFSVQAIAPRSPRLV